MRLGVLRSGREVASDPEDRPWRLRMAIINMVMVN
jgi:hypothetical protein